MDKNKFQIKKEETYNQLIQKGTEVFLEKGYAKTTIADIAKAAGNTRGAFYFHFEGKEDCFMHMMRVNDERRGTDWRELPKQFHPQTTPLEKVLQQALDLHFTQVYGESFTGWMFVVIDFYQSVKDKPELTEELKALHEHWEKDLVIFMNLLQDQGYISSSHNAEDIAFQFIMLLYGYLINHYIYDKKDMNLLTQAFLKLVS